MDQVKSRKGRAAVRARTGGPGTEGEMINDICNEKMFNETYRFVHVFGPLNSAKSPSALGRWLVKESGGRMTEGGALRKG